MFAVHWMKRKSVRNMTFPVINDHHFWQIDKPWLVIELVHKARLESAESTGGIEEPDAYSASEFLHVINNSLREGRWQVSKRMVPPPLKVWPGDIGGSRIASSVSSLELMLTPLTCGLRGLLDTIFWAWHHIQLDVFRSSESLLTFRFRLKTCSMILHSSSVQDLTSLKQTPSGPAALFALILECSLAEFSSLAVSQHEHNLKCVTNWY